MTQYNLTFNGAQINEAIEKARVHVVGLDTAPQQGSNKVVNSDGIYTAVNSKISTSDIVTEAQTIAANDVDTKVPSAAAVKDYIETVAGPNVSTMTRSSETTTSSDSFIDVTGLTVTGPHITGGPNYTLAAGYYLIRFSVMLTGYNYDGNAGVFRLFGGTTKYFHNDPWSAYQGSVAGQINGLDMRVSSTLGRTTYGNYGREEHLYIPSDLTFNVQHEGNSDPSKLKEIDIRFIKLDRP